MDKTVVIYIQAYSAERTLRRTLESVLCQTYTDWIIYLVNNGSTDGTANIISEYAKKDSRIIYKFVATNDLWYFYTFIDEYLKSPLGSYFAVLDADDEYTMDFLEVLMSSMRRNNLTCCVCGTDYIDAMNGDILFTKKPDTDFVISGNAFSERFLEYRRFTDTLWGKIYTLQLMQSLDYKRIPRIGFAPDSVVVLELFKQSYQLVGTIGFLSQSLHRYYRAPNTLSSQVQLASIQYVRDLHIYYDTLHNYLRCFGNVSKLNQDYLYAIWLGWIQNLLTHCESNGTVEQSLASLYAVFTNPITSAMFTRDADPQFRNLASRGEFLKRVIDWIFTHEGWEKHREK